MTQRRTTSHPEWATKHRRSGTELRLIRGNYYLYEYKTVYDKEKKKPKKISGKLIGTISEENGLVESEKRKLERTKKQTDFSNIFCKEYGMSFIITTNFSQYLNTLKASFGNIWALIAAIAYCRFVYKCPLKNIPFCLAQSFLPQMLGIDVFNEKTASAVLKEIGSMKSQQLSYMHAFINKGEHILIDATGVFSNSQQISLAKKGYSHNMNFDKHFNLMYIYSADSKMPVYYRLLPGNIREVKAFSNCLREANLSQAIIITDKGFYSKKNIELLEAEKLKYIIPLKRDNALINYQELTDNTFKQSNSYFEHEGRVIWHGEYVVDKKQSLFLYLDELLRLKEETDYIKRISTLPESYSMDGYHQKRNVFGTIALLTNLKKHEAIDVYQSYKSRMSIEVMFDGMKNVLDADHTYMQDEQTLQGWMFVNHIALQWYQHLYLDLKKRGLLKKYSVNDYIHILCEIKKIKINDNWYFNETTSYTKKLVNKVGLNLE